MERPEIPASLHDLDLRLHLAGLFVHGIHLPTGESASEPHKGAMRRLLQCVELGQPQGHLGRLFD